MAIPRPRQHLLRLLPLLQLLRAKRYRSRSRRGDPRVVRIRVSPRSVPRIQTRLKKVSLRYRCRGVRYRGPQDTSYGPPPAAHAPRDGTNGAWNIGPIHSKSHSHIRKRHRNLSMDDVRSDLVWRNPIRFSPVGQPCAFPVSQRSQRLRGDVRNTKWSPRGVNRGSRCFGRDGLCHIALYMHPGPGRTRPAVFAPLGGRPSGQVL